MTGPVITKENRDAPLPFLNGETARWPLWAAPLSFAVLYCVAAFLKPFHVDEFYSWVYAQRSTFTEILCLKEFGIGHPPLYHLLQKTVMGVLPGYHFLDVRLVNFVAGTFFVWLMARLLSDYGKPGVFAVAVGSSAAVLDVFILSRMWGLVCLSSLLLLKVGERYAATREPRLLPLLAGVCLLGVFSDYNFIVMTPYVLLVLLHRPGSSLPLKLVYGLLLPVALLPLLHYALIEKDVGMLAYWLADAYPLSLPLLSFEAALAVLGFWFLEPLILALMILLAAVWSAEYKVNGTLSPRHWSKGNLLILAGIILASLEGLVRYAEVRTRYALLSVLFALALMVVILRGRRFWACFDVRDRVLHGSVGGMVILAAANPLFWRELRFARFMVAMLPFFFLWVFLHLDRRALNLLSVVLILSGVLYAGSGRVGEFYPPKIMSAGKPDLYEDEFSYSNQYLKGPQGVAERPVFLNTRGFGRYCQTCAMGRKAEEADLRGEFSLLANSKFDVDRLSRKYGLTLAGKRDVALPLLDRLQFDYLTPVHLTRYMLLDFKS